MGLNRPYIRKSVREAVENKAEKDELGRFLDANEKTPIEGKYDIGHVYGHEFRRERASAENEGLTQPEFNDRMNESDILQIEDPKVNRSGIYECKDPIEFANNSEEEGLDSADLFECNDECSENESDSFLDFDESDENELESHIN